MSSYYRQIRTDALLAPLRDKLLQSVTRVERDDALTALTAERDRLAQCSDTAIEAEHLAKFGTRAPDSDVSEPRRDAYGDALEAKRNKMIEDRRAMIVTSQAPRDPATTSRNDAVEQPVYREDHGDQLEQARERMLAERRKIGQRP